MLKLISIALFLIIVTKISAQPPQPIPSYVVLPQMPTNPTPPLPGQPSSYSIDKIRNRRGAINATKATFSSSSSEDKDSDSYNKKFQMKQNPSIQQHPIDADGKVRIQPLMAQQSFDEIHASPVTYKYEMNQTTTANSTENSTTAVVEEKMSTGQ